MLPQYIVAFEFGSLASTIVLNVHTKIILNNYTYFWIYTISWIEYHFAHPATTLAIVFTVGPLELPRLHH